MLDTLKSKYRRHEEKAYTQVETKVSKAVVKVVICRVISILLLFTTAVLLTFAIVFHPWKQEFKENSHKKLEVSIWKVCRVTNKGSRCYDDAMEELPAWFQAFKWFLILSMAFQYFGLFFSIIKVALTKNNLSRAFWIPAFASLISAAMILTAMVILVAFWDFGFIEDARNNYMGWREDADTEEASGLPRTVGYWSFGVTLFTFLFCMYTHFVDERFSRSYDRIRANMPSTFYQ